MLQEANHGECRPPVAAPAPAPAPAATAAAAAGLLDHGHSLAVAVAPPAQPPSSICPVPANSHPAGPGIGVPPPAPDASHLNHTHRRIALLVRPTPPIPRLQAAPPPAISRPERGGPHLLELGRDPPARPGPRHGGKPTWPSSPSSSTIRATGRRHRWSCSRCRTRCPPTSTAHPPAPRVSPSAPFFAIALEEEGLDYPDPGSDIPLKRES